MLYELSNFLRRANLPKLPVFLDSPLAIKGTAVYEKWGLTYFKPETEDEMKRKGVFFEFPFLKDARARRVGGDREGAGSEDYHRGSG